MSKQQKQPAKKPKKNLRFLSLSVLVSAVALSSFLFFTWIVNDVFHVTETYESALYTIQATFVTLLIVLIPVNLSLYRSRKKELEILSTAIHKVSEGDYSCRIAADEKSSLMPIYEDFNKMCGELESVQILRNDFINNYSHEFKTPITSINGFASLLLERELPEEERRQYLEIIVEESARLSQLATNTILLSRLNNAVKYTPEGGRISVEVMPEKEVISVAVSDTGEGMDRKTREHLFEPYFQGDTSRARQGLGLGLSICKRIAELCGCTIRVESEPGKGSCFTVTLPAK